MISFFLELRRRKVIQVAIGYAIVAWLLAQVAALIEEPLRLPGWFDAFIIVTLAIAFPIVVIISWAFNVTSEGLVRDTGPEESAIDGQKTGQSDGSPAPAVESTENSSASLEHENQVPGIEQRSSDKPSIAVLPFQTMSGSENEDYLSDGIVEAITAELSCIRSFFVIARNSAFAFKGRLGNLVEIGEELRVAYLLEGSVQRHGDRVRITAQLIETANGTHISDDSLVLTVLGAVRTIVRDFGGSRALLERAVAIDANAAWAWQRLGWLETYLDHSEVALENFARALRLSPLDPMNFNVLAGMGSAFEVAEDYDKAVVHYRRALQDRPNAYWINRHLASALVGAGDTDGARTAYAKLIERYPGLTADKVRAAMLYTEPTMEKMVARLKELGLPE